MFHRPSSCASSVYVTGGPGLAMLVMPGPRQLHIDNGDRRALRVDSLFVGALQGRLAGRRVVSLRLSAQGGSGFFTA